MTCSHDTPWRECQCECDAGKIGNRSPAQVLAESGVLDAVSYYDSSGEMIKAFEDEDVSTYVLGSNSRCFTHVSFLGFKMSAMENIPVGR